MKRVRFKISREACGGDPRPMVWDARYPYWCDEMTAKDYIFVAYCENYDQLHEGWPEFTQKSVCYYTDDAEIEFTNRYPRPEWWVDENEEAV